MSGRFKGVPYSGLNSGRWYDAWMLLGGWTPSFYRRAAETIGLAPGFRVLELGCGTASLSLAMAARVQPGGEIHGVDLSPQQLTRARRKVRGCDATFVFHQGSMDELTLERSSFDVVVSCLALAQVPGEVRRAAITRAVSLLKPGGRLALIEPGRPRLGYQSILMAPFFRMIPDWRDLWHNRLVELCQDEGLELRTDVYLTSMARCQIFAGPVGAARSM